MSQGLIDELHNMAWELKAKRYPEIPKWLADNPPRSCQFYPKGLILTNGPLGWDEERDGDCRVTVDAGDEDFLGYFLFDYEGNLLEFTEDHWTTIWFDSTRQYHPGGIGAHRIDRYYIVTDSDPNSKNGIQDFVNPCGGKVLAVYDWDGSLTDFREAPPLRNVDQFANLNAHQIKRFYEIQQKLKQAGDL